MAIKNTYAVVTGASSGIGAAIAKQLAKEGYSLILIARRKDKLEEVKRNIEKYIHKDGICISYPMDVTNATSCYDLMEYLQDQRVGVFVNNAGFGDCNYFPNAYLEKELSMIDVNIKALHLLTKLFLKKFQLQKRGYLLNVASSAGLMPAGPYMATYYATKAYVTSLTRAISTELKDHGSRIYVGCLCPGPVDTEFNSVANVKFSLPGISATYCAKAAIAGMKKRQTVIIPSLSTQLLVNFSRLLPSELIINTVKYLQKRKLKNS